MIFWGGGLIYEKKARGGEGDVFKNTWPGTLGIRGQEWRNAPLRDHGSVRGHRELWTLDARGREGSGLVAGAWAIRRHMDEEKRLIYSGPLVGEVSGREGEEKSGRSFGYRDNYQCTHDPF